MRFMYCFPCPPDDAVHNLCLYSAAEHWDSSYRQSADTRPSAALPSLAFLAPLGTTASLAETEGMGKMAEKELLDPRGHNEITACVCVCVCGCVWVVCVVCVCVCVCVCVSEYMYVCDSDVSMYMI